MSLATVIQSPGIILPDVSAFDDIVGTETETIDDLVEHTSYEFATKLLQEKQIHIVATEVSLFAASVPGNLWCWVELSPLPSANNDMWESPLLTSTDAWAAIGGGGGALTPTAPYVEISGLAGAAGTLIHTIILPWTIHSPWARLVVQTPIAASLPLAYWVIQAVITAKTP